MAVPVGLVVLVVVVVVVVLIIVVVPVARPRAHRDDFTKSATRKLKRGDPKKIGNEGGGRWQADPEDNRGRDAKQERLGKEHPRRSGDEKKDGRRSAKRGGVSLGAV